MDANIREEIDEIYRIIDRTERLIEKREQLRLEAEEKQKEAKAEEEQERKKAKAEEEQERKKAKAEEEQERKKAKAEEEQERKKAKAEEEQERKKAKAEEEQERKKAKAEEEQERKASKTEFDLRMKKLGELVGNYGNNQGDIAEDFFSRTLQKIKCLGNIHFDEVQRNVKIRFRKQEGEYDVVLYNGDSVGLVEVKSKLHHKDVEKFLTIDIPKFKKLFPQMKDYRIYGAVAGMAVPEETQEYAESQGLFVLTQAHEKLICANTHDFQAREF